ncbi:MAG: class III extradiol ring-cleavage dioxygenase [Elainellaceae cyanobacterium]
MTPFPSLFVSHGAPNLPLYASPAREFLSQLGQDLGKPNAILIISPHWLSDRPTVSIAPQVHAVHDFGGFPQELYELTYDAPGAPDLAEQVVAVLSHAGVEPETTSTGGLDHGAWVPLKLMYPEADVPIIQLSLPYRKTPEQLLTLGHALAPLRQSGLLILASGSATHNLKRLGRYARDDNNPPDWVLEFDQWLAGAIAQNDTARLLDYRHQAPHAVDNHPTDEHLRPLFIALGAGGKTSQGKRLHSSYTYGILSMAAYAFEEKSNL